MCLVEIYLRALLNIYYMSEYTKPCIFCKAEIRMSNKNEGKWRRIIWMVALMIVRPPTRNQRISRIITPAAIRIERKKPLPWRKGFQD